MQIALRREVQGDRKGTGTVANTAISGLDASMLDTATTSITNSMKVSSLRLADRMDEIVHQARP